MHVRVRTACGQLHVDYHLLVFRLPLDGVQFLAGHISPRTTKLYDRRQKPGTRNIVERISI